MYASKRAAVADRSLPGASRSRRLARQPPATAGARLGDCQHPGDPGTGHLPAKRAAAWCCATRSCTACPTLRVYRYLRRYWERGQNANALLPDYKNSGGRGKTRSVNPAVKRGRPRKGEGHPGMNACDDVRETFHDAVARYAAAHPRFSRRGAYRQMIEDFFSTQAPDATPTFGQFNYWIEKDACLAQRHAAVAPNGASARTRARRNAGLTSSLS
ncbi:hypothetical protein LP419_32985 [Massilia sp. H-1]|nr:hypothetical protein LP419_32985 [Massilia sp. H-1]